MLTWPTYGGRFFRQTNGRSAWVVKIVKGTSTWLFSTVDMQLTDGHVYPLLLNDVSIQSQVDLITKQWSVQDVGVIIKNCQYKQNTAHAWVSFGDEADTIRNANLSIYVMAGTSPTALSDGLLMFSGSVQDPASVTIDEVSLMAIDSLRIKNVILPQTFVPNSGGAPISSRLRKLPIIYGKFTKAYDDTVDFGLARGELLTYATKPTFVFSSHICKSIDYAYESHPQLPHPSKMVSPTLNADNGGRATAIAVGEADAYLTVDGQDHGASTRPGDGGGSPAEATDPLLACDLDPSTCATHTGDNIYFGWPDYDQADHLYLSNIGKIVGRLSSGTYYVDVQWRVTATTSATFDLVYGFQQSLMSQAITTGATHSVAVSMATGFWDSRIFWHFRSGMNTDLSGNHPICACISNAGTGATYYVRLIVRYVPKRVRSMFAACQGRMFGSWIDAGGRSNSYNANDLIEDPAFIIESILRDELGFTSTDIDTASFDAAANSLVKARINIHSDNENDAYFFTRQLAEQSTFAFVVTSASKARLINLKTSNPTIARTLHVSDIDVESIRYTKNAKMVNDVRVKHRWKEEYGEFYDYDTYGDTNSSSAFGLYTQDFKWQNITSEYTVNDSVFEVAGFIRDTWANQFTTISFTCLGIRNCDLEVGDWIQFDSPSISPHILCFGVGWYGKEFLISRIRHTPLGTTIEATNLANLSQRSIVAASGSYALTGRDAGMWKKGITAEKGNYTLTGNNVNLTKA